VSVGILIELTDLFRSQVGSVEKSLPDSLVLIGLTYSLRGQVSSVEKSLPDPLVLIGPTITGGVYRLSLLVGQVSAIEGRAGGCARRGFIESRC
jgi:hypothetical protein